MPRLLRRLVPLVATLALPLVSVASSGAGLIRAPLGPPVVPRTQQAAVYDLFGASPGNRALLANVTEHLSDEGYRVKLYRDSNEGLGGQGGATLPNFVKMAKTASVIVINTHGTDFLGASRGCASGKGLGRLTGDPTQNSVWICLARSHEPVLQVEWYPTDAKLHAAYDRYTTTGGFKRSWLFESTPKMAALTLIKARPGDGRSDQTSEGIRPWLGITASGIKHFFGGRNVDLIDNLACHSMSFEPDFDAGAYFGHASTACTQFEEKDEPILFDRLTGHEGVPVRSTFAAWKKGGFVDSQFDADVSRDIVLSPAVQAVAPGDGDTLIVGDSNPAQVAFDAKMDTANPAGVVTVSGCGASIANAKWNADGTTLAYAVNVPAEVVGGTATVTISAKAATAGSGDGPNAELDGNADPGGDTDGGIEPNGDDYVYHLVCHDREYPVKVDYTGTYQDDYTGQGIGFHEKLTWHETQTYHLSFTDGRYTSTSDPATLTASGSLSSTGTSPDDSCTIEVAPAPAIPMSVTSGKETFAPSGAASGYFGSFGASMPIRSFDPDRELAVSGTPDDCALDTGSGVAPYLFYHPALGGFDPGGKLNAAWGGSLPDVNLDGLVAAPLVVSFPVEYTELDQFGGSDHVVVSATATVSLTGPPTGS